MNILIIVPKGTDDDGSELKFPCNTGSSSVKLKNLRFAPIFSYIYYLNHAAHWHNIETNQYIEQMLFFNNLPLGTYGSNIFDKIFD